jgi:putative flippase GtrA
VRALVKDAVGYAGASVCALGVDMALLALLVQEFSWPYLLAATVSFSAGICVAYLLSVRLVFAHRRRPDRRTEFVSFAVLGAIGLGVNAAVMFVLVRYLGVYYLFAKCASAGCTFAYNFLSRRQLLFSGRAGS